MGPGLLVSGRGLEKACLRETVRDGRRVTGILANVISLCKRFGARGKTLGCAESLSMNQVSGRRRIDEIAIRGFSIDIAVFFT